MKRKWIAGTTAVLLVLLLLASYMAIAAETSDREDPLVALSYLTDVLAPETIEKVNAAIEMKADQMETSINQILTDYTTELDTKIAEFESRNENIATDSSFIAAVTTSVLAQLNGSAPADGEGEGTPAPAITGASGWQLVQVKKGETYRFAVGGMVLLRIGSASCYTPSNPGIIDTSSGTELPGGESLQKNHLYLITVAERGFKATSDSKIMVYGSYTVG